MLKRVWEFLQSSMPNYTDPDAEDEDYEEPASEDEDGGASTGRKSKILPAAKDFSQKEMGLKGHCGSKSGSTIVIEDEDSEPEYKEKEHLFGELMGMGTGELKRSHDDSKIESKIDFVDNESSNEGFPPWPPCYQTNKKLKTHNKENSSAYANSSELLRENNKQCDRLYSNESQPQSSSQNNDEKLYTRPRSYDSQQQYIRPRSNEMRSFPIQREAGTIRSFAIQREISAIRSFTI